MEILSLILALACLLVTCFSPSLMYTQKVESGYVSGSGSFYNDGSKHVYSGDSLLYGKSEILLIVGLVLLAISLLVYLSKKNRGLYYGLNIFVSTAFIIIAIVAKINMSSSMSYISSGFASYGSGKVCRLTFGGWIGILLSLASIGYAIYMIVKELKKMQPDPVVVQNKNNIKPDEWSL